MKNSHLISFFVLTLFLGSCVSRLQRHSLCGTLVDIHKKPVNNCNVGETKTDSAGYFCLPEIRYNRFLPAEILHTEAPSVFYREAIAKEGYKRKTIDYFNKFGGGLKKGAHRELDTIYLVKEEPSKAELDQLLQGQWEMRFGKNTDIIYMVRSGFEKLCKTAECRLFQANSFKRGTGSMIFMYDGFSAKTAGASAEISGTWQVDEDHFIKLQSNSKALNGMFYLTDFGYSYLFLTRSN